jgi:DNA-directed RNA polymerase III subunit RPC3
VRVRDLLQQFVAHGESDNYDASPAALEHRIIHLLYERFFVFAKPTDAIIPAEHHRELRATIKAEAKKSLSEAKLKLHIEERVAAEVGKQQRAEDEKLHALHRAVADLTSLGGGADGPPRKKVKTESGALATTLLDGDAFVRFNYSKLGVISRTNDLVKLCTVCYGEEVGQVYGKMLATLQLTTSSCTQNTKRCRVITEKDVARAVPADLFLDDAWCSPPPSTRKVRKQRTQAPVIHNGDNSDEIMSDEERSEDSEVGQDTRGPSIHSKRILALLANSHIPFVSKTGPEAYVLDFDILGQVLRERQIEALVMQQLGPTALRLLRIVKEKRKIDEKQLYAMALLQHKDIRQALTNLHQLGVLELQEVPKRLDRQPSLTLYFWFHKQDKAAMTLASQMCQAMARIHQRLEAMLKEKSRLLAKSKRTDVRNREAELMSPAELRDLRGVYAMQDRLLCQCARAYHAYRSLIQY